MNTEVVKLTVEIPQMYVLHIYKNIKTLPSERVFNIVSEIKKKCSNIDDLNANISAEISIYDLKNLITIMSVQSERVHTKVNAELKGALKNTVITLLQSPDAEAQEIGTYLQNYLEDYENQTQQEILLTAQYEKTNL